uniref:Nuclear receptor n=1 Tax=Parastrongyloides trichosuri TaxID=131310 RepID=A0A0N4Z131_PARTI
MTVLNPLNTLSSSGVNVINSVNGASMCEVCGDYSDGYHYKIQACRSCTAFMRRCVSFNRLYNCRFSNNCQIDFRNRNTCKACRYNKCISKGMDTTLVQPKREPTGALGGRRRRSLYTSNITTNEANFDIGNIKSEPLSEASTINQFTVFTEESEKYNIQNSINVPTISISSSLNFPKTSKSTSENFLKSVLPVRRKNYMIPFYNSVRRYREIQNLNAHLSVPFPHFLTQNTQSRPPLRILLPNDLDLLCRMQLSNANTWLSPMSSFHNLLVDEKTNLYKRFLLRKINLDTFHMTSKYPEHIGSKCLVLQNYTIVPPNMTGYEKNDDSETKKRIRLSVFRDSINDTFDSIIKPMSELQLTDIEIVALYFLMFWSKSNEKYVGEEKRRMFNEQRNWAMSCLFTHYCENSIPEPEVRFGEILSLLTELEWGYIVHCRDYLMSELFKVNDLKVEWFDRFVYSEPNFQL